MESISEWIATLGTSVANLPFQARVTVGVAGLKWLPPHQVAAEIRVLEAVVDAVKRKVYADDEGVSLAAMVMATMQLLQGKVDSGMAAKLIHVLEVVVLPVLQNDHVKEYHHQVGSAFGEVLVAIGAWSVVSEILDQAAKVFTRSKIPDVNFIPETPVLEDVETWNFQTVLSLFPSLAQSFAKASSVPNALDSIMLDQINRQFNDLIPMVLDLLSSEDRETRQVVMQKLIPSLVFPISSQGDDHLLNYVEQVWMTCQEMMEMGSGMLCTALGVLVQFSEYLGISGDGEIMDVTQDATFWEHLRTGLMEPSELSQKQARLIIETAWKKEDDGQLWRQPFLDVFDLLDEFSTHLVDQKWHLMDDLHIEDESLGGQRSNLNEAQMSPRISVEWMQILWKKAFVHKNHQVKKLAAKSFLQRKWTESCVSQFESSFVLKTLMPLLGEPLLHNDSEYDYEMGMEAFLSKYILVLTPSNQESFMISMVQAISEGLPRIVAKSWISLFHALTQEVSSSVISDAGNDKILGFMPEIFSNILAYHGEAFRVELCGHFIAGVSSLVSVSDLCPLKLAHTLVVLPRDMVFQGGPLHEDLVKWLATGEDMDAWMKTGIASGMKKTISMDSNATSVGSSDINMWDKEAYAIALLLSLRATSGAQIDDLLRVIVQNLQSMHSRPYFPNGSASKTLLILRALLKAGLRCSSSSALGKGMLGIMSAAGESLSAYAEAAAHGVWSHTASGNHPKDPSGEQGGRSCTAYVNVCERALLSTECLMDSALFTCCSAKEVLKLERQAGPQERVVRNMIGSADKILCHLLRRIPLMGSADCEEDAEFLGCALKMLQHLCKGVARCSKEVHESMSIAPLMHHPKLYDIVHCALEPTKECRASSTMKQMLELSKWQCIEAAFEVAKCGLCSEGGALEVHHKVELLDELLRALEYAQDSLLEALFSSLRPLLKSLLTDALFVECVETSMGLKGLSGIMWNVVERFWAAFVDVRKRTMIITSAFMNTAFLQDLFLCQSSMDPVWVLHEEDGPMSWLVKSILEMGQRSPRVMLLATLKLTGVLLQSPSLVELYLGSLLTIVLYGTVDKGHTEHQADPRGARALEEMESCCAKDSGIVDAYIATRVGPRAAVVCFIYELAQLAAASTSSSDGEHSRRRAACSAGRSLWDHLLSFALTDPQQNLAQYNTGSSTHRMKTRLWQALCVCSNFVTGNEDTVSALSSLEVLLDKGNVASVRMFMESTMVKLFVSGPHRMWQMALPVIEHYEERNEALPSYMLISLQVALATSSPEQLSHLLAAMLPWTLSHNHATRAFSQLAVHTLLTEIKAKCDEHNIVSFMSSRLVDRLSEFFDTNRDMQRLVNTLGGGVRSFSTKEIGTPESVFVTGINLAGYADEEVTFEGAPSSLLQQLRDYLSWRRAGVREVNHAQIVAKEAGSSLVPPSVVSMPAVPNLNLTGDYQRKILPLDRSFGCGVGGFGNLFQSLDLDLSKTGDFLARNRECGSQHVGQQPSTMKQELIVVASLINKIPNLGGLARTCEVFRSNKLVLADSRVVKDQQFTSISMTSEQWLSIDEVNPVALLPWLEARRQEGYTLVGVEQTCESTVLAHYKFPPKCVIVLGKEKEGIPPSILLALDATVEIPQLGLVRSLNVHVSGALVMYEYCRQIHGWGGAFKA